jgi:ribosomal protein S18 acetylase RimI-like enzyme
MNTEYEIKHLNNKKDIDGIYQFLTSKEAFDTIDLPEGEKESLKKSVQQTFGDEKSSYFYIEDGKGRIIGVIGAFENEIKTGGYYLGYFAVSVNHRGQGLGSKLLTAAEDFVRAKRARYLIIETGDETTTATAIGLYTKFGFEKVGFYKDYYNPGDPKSSYMKSYDY